MQQDFDLQLFALEQLQHKIVWVLLVVGQTALVELALPWAQATPFSYLLVWIWVGGPDVQHVTSFCVAS